MRLLPSVIVFAAAAHIVGVLVAIVCGLIFVPAISVLWGAGAASALVLIGSLAMHVLIDAAFTVPMRRLSASLTTCTVNLLAAHIIVILIGTGLAAAGAAVGPGDANQPLYLQAIGMLVWAILSAAIGITVGLGWPRLRNSDAGRLGAARQRRGVRR